MSVRRLARGPARVTDLTIGLGPTQATVSKHPACLRDGGLVTSEPAGRASLFRLTQPALAEVLAAVETVLSRQAAQRPSQVLGIQPAGGETRLRAATH